MRSEKSIFYANRGVKRNKKPIQNIIYWFILLPVEKIEAIVPGRAQEYDIYKFKDLGYLWMDWAHQKDYNKCKIKNIHGFITPERLRKTLGQEQYSKFCQGKREFIIQRRINGNNT